MKIKQGGDPPSVDVDMTPMIDIVFQLITFFMVVINFEAADLDERVKMATSQLARPPVGTPEDELILQIGYIRNTNGVLQGRREDPFVFFNGDAFLISETASGNYKSIVPIIKDNEFRYRRRHPKPEPIKTVVVIRADQDCPAGKVQELIQFCQKSEFEKFSVKAAAKSD